jgi:hypothetical protein
MPYEIDTDKLNDPSLQVLDIGKPPVRQMAHQPFPKMLYLHPKDKTKEHRTLIVHSDSELEAAQSKGWKTQPHVPVEALEDLSKHFEAESPQPSKAQLLERAKQLGITSVDGRNTVESIQVAIKDAEASA